MIASKRLSGIAFQLARALQYLASTTSVGKLQPNNSKESKMKIKSDRRVRSPFGDFQVDVDDLVNHFFGDRGSNTQGWVPPVMISENDSAYVVSVELPGVNPEEVDLELTDGVLQISGQKSLPELPEGESYLRNERRKGAFKRVFEFAKSVDSESIEAVFENGLLRITLPLSEKILPRKIEIKTQ